VAKLRSLEMLRAIAALLVVLFHTQIIFDARAGHVPFGGLFGSGNRGVDLFFVLSGFIIAYVHGDDMGRPSRLTNYLFNRIARIYPAVWVMTVPAIVIYSLGFGGADKAVKLVPTSIVASALLLPQTGVALVNVTWTLTYEIFFYALFAITIVNLRAGLVLLLLWQTATAAIALSGIYSGLPNSYVGPLCLEFGVGLACAWWIRRSQGAKGPFAWAVLLAAGIVVFVIGMWFDDAISWSGALPALGAGMVIVALVRMEQAGRLRVPNLLVTLGGASYAIYLVHFSIITLFAAALVHWRVPVTDVLCAAVAASAVIAGLLFDRIVDQPIQRWLRQRKVEMLGRKLPQTS